LAVSPVYLLTSAMSFVLFKAVLSSLLAQWANTHQIISSAPSSNANQTDEG
jgi:hypothetical protein